MEKIYQYWTSPKGDGYSTAEVSYQADGIDRRGKDWYGKERKSLQAAINDAKRHFKKYNEEDVEEWYYSIYAFATLTDYYDDGRQVGKSERDAVMIGTIDINGEYFDMCEPVEWLD